MSHTTEQSSSPKRRRQQQQPEAEQQGHHRLHHPLHRRKLAIPDSSLEEVQENAYEKEESNERLWQSIIHQPRQSRPLPSSQVLSSTITTNNSAPKIFPLLRDGGKYFATVWSR